MAKYLKSNQIKAGMTVYVVHPKFPWVERCFVTNRPHRKFNPKLNKCMGWYSISTR